LSAGFLTSAARVALAASSACKPLSIPYRQQQRRSTCSSRAYLTALETVTAGHGLPAKYSTTTTYVSAAQIT
jgi:hypothetical protein